MELKIVICPRCLQKFNMEYSMCGGTPTENCPYFCPHCKAVWEKGFLLDCQKELKSIKKEEK